MMTLQIQIDEATLAEVDESLGVLHQNREDFFKEAIERSAAKLKREAEVSKMYRKAYAEQPIGDDEFLIDEDQILESWIHIPWEPKNETW